MTPGLARVMYGKINATFDRIEKLLVRFRAGLLWRVTRQGPRNRGMACHAPTLGRGAGQPRKFGWLVLAGTHQAAGFGVQLQTVLATPDMTALLEASPQARRILRPLCRALAMELPWTVTPPRTPKPRKPRQPRPKPEPFKIPLPRGVLSWARRDGFGKLC